MIKGCTQKLGIVFNENFSPLAKSTSIRTAFLCGIQNEFTAYQQNFITPYVNGGLTEEIYKKISEGFKNVPKAEKVFFFF